MLFLVIFVLHLIPVSLEPNVEKSSTKGIAFWSSTTVWSFTLPNIESHRWGQTWQEQCFDLWVTNRKQRMLRRGVVSGLALSSDMRTLRIIKTQDRDHLCFLTEEALREGEIQQLSTGTLQAAGRSSLGKVSPSFTCGSATAPSLRNPGNTPGTTQSTTMRSHASRYTPLAKVSLRALT